jgi:chemotaxis protein CheY-P-specific phosphatase CheC
MLVLKKNLFKKYNTMRAELNKVELDITKEIVNIGLSKAADSLSFFIREKVLIKLVDIKFNPENYSPISRKNDSQKSYVLTTYIRGDIGGKSLLIFNESEVEKLIDANLPDSIKNNPVEKANMMDAILLEIDNIITASVITQFANILQCKLYGDVPGLNVIPENMLNQYLDETNPHKLNVIYFNSQFITKDLDINPEFVWLMDDSFYSGVKNVVSDEKKIELLQKFNINS